MKFKEVEGSEHGLILWYYPSNYLQKTSDMTVDDPTGIQTWKLLNAIQKCYT
jgi:hypothetical protein